MGNGSRRWSRGIEIEFRPRASHLDRMHAGDCMFNGCDGGLAVDVTFLWRLTSQPVGWSVCSRHGRDLVDLLAGRVYWLGVEDHGVHQGALDLG